MARTFPVESTSAEIPAFLPGWDIGAGYVGEYPGGGLRSGLINPYAPDLPEFYNRERVFGSKANLLRIYGARQPLIDAIVSDLGRSAQGETARQNLLLSDYLGSQGDLAQKLYGEKVAFGGLGSAFLEDLQRGATSRDLLAKLYTQGADIFGVNLTSEALARAIKNAKINRKIDIFGNIFGGIPYIGGVAQGIINTAKK